MNTYYHAYLKYIEVNLFDKSGTLKMRVKISVISIFTL